MLRERVEYWKEQTKRTTRRTIDKKALQRMAQDIISAYSSDLEASDITGDLDSLYAYILNNGDENNDLTYEEARRRANKIASRIAESASVADDESYLQYKDMRDYFRKTAIMVSDEDSRHITDYGDFRQRNFGRMNLKKGKSNIDQMFQEAAYLWPEFFDEQTAMTAPDQLLRMAEVLDGIYHVEQRNPFDTYMDAAVVDIANEIMERFFDLPQTRPTFADRQADRLETTKARARQQVQQAREQRDARLAELRKQNRERMQRMAQRERETRARQIERLKTRYAERDSAGRERRSARELRARITRHVSDLSGKLLRPSDKQHIPENLRNSVAAMLRAINLESAYTVDPETGKRKMDAATKQMRAVNDYKASVERWDENDDGGYFRLGYTPENLASVGIPQNRLYFDKSKAAKALRDHAEVTKGILASIPDLLADPIVVAESYDNTALVFGELYDAGGHPIVVALRVNSTARGNNVELVNKIRNVGARSHDLDKLLSDQNVVFLAEKNRADKWFQALGRSTPFGGTKYGSIRRVSFAPENVKTSLEGIPTKRTEAFLKLREAYQKIEQQDGEIVVDPSLLGDKETQGKFDQVIEMRDVRLDDMSTEQLRTVWEVIRAVEYSITTAGRTLSGAKFAKTQDWAAALERDTRTRRAKHTLTNIGAMKSLENPYTFFSHYGEAGLAIYRMLRDAQDRQQIMIERVSEEVKKIVDQKTAKRLEKTAHDFVTERGDSLTLSTSDVMDIYNLMKRGQAHDHLLQGGIVQPEVKSRRIRRGTEAIRLSMNDLNKIVNALSKEEMEIADGLQKITSGLLADYGNEASMKAYGYKKFTDPDYWTIYSAKEGLYSSSENRKNNVKSIKNIGLAKPTVPNAKNPLEILGIFSTFARHAADMIDYASWLVPMEDANRLFNYQYRGEDGVLNGKTVKGLLDRVGGSGAQKYWENLMDDIQNGITSPGDDPLTQIFTSTIGSFKSAAVGGNLRVVIQQPTAFFRAGLVLSPDDMAKGLLRGATRGSGWEKALQYSPIAKRKDMGGFDISNPAKMEETLFDNRSGVKKLNDKMTSLAAKADAWTWGRLWNACEWATARQHQELRRGSEEFYRMVNELFTEVIDQTQVVDGVLQRSNIMRSSNAFAQQATNFMGEPIMTLNIMMRAYDQMRYEQNPKKRGKAIKNFGRATMAVLAAYIANSLAQSIIDAVRDDDKDKTYWERFMSAFTGLTGEEESAWDKAIAVVLGGNAGSALNPAEQIPYARDILSLVKGYDVSRTDMEVFADLVRAVQTVIQNADGKGPKTRAYAMQELVSAVAKVFGTPVGNVTRDVWSIFRSFVYATGNIPLQYEMEKAIYNITPDENTTRYLDLLYAANQSDDKAVYEHIYNDLVKNGYTEEQIQRGMESRMKEEQGVKSVKDLEQRYLTPPQQKHYDRLYRQVSNSPVWTSANRAQQNDVEDDLYNLAAGTEAGEKLREKINGGSTYGISEADYILYLAALEVADAQNDDPEKRNGSIDQDEAQAAIDMLTGLSDDARAYLWQSTNKGWNEKKNPYR